MKFFGQFINQSEVAINGRKNTSELPSLGGVSIAHVGLGEDMTLMGRWIQIRSYGMLIPYLWEVRKPTK